MVPGLTSPKGQAPRERHGAASAPPYLHRCCRRRSRTTRGTRTRARVHAGLTHVTDALQSQRPRPWHRAPPGAARARGTGAPAGPGQPARRRRAAPAGATDHSGGHGHVQALPFCSEGTTPQRGRRRSLRVHPDPEPETRPPTPWGSLAWAPPPPTPTFLRGPS